MGAPKEPETYKLWKENITKAVSGEKNGFFGKHHSQETRDSLSESHKGNIPWNKGMKGYGKGHIVTAETRRLISIAHKGKPKKKGFKHSKATKRKIALAKIGKPRPPAVIEAIRKAQTGRKHTQEHIQKRIDSLMKNGNALCGEKNPMYGVHRFGKENPMYGKVPWNKGVPHSPQTLQKMKDKRKYQVIPQKDTKPERMMALALMLHGIKFEKHKALVGQPDIFIEPNICIFVDGNYFHANPDEYGSECVMQQGKHAKDIWAKDIRINHELNRQGYFVIRIWESDIKTDVNNCAVNILAMIKQRSYLSV